MNQKPQTKGPTMNDTLLQAAERAVDVWSKGPAHSLPHAMGPLRREVDRRMKILENAWEQTQDHPLPWPFVPSDEGGFMWLRTIGCILNYDPALYYEEDWTRCAVEPKVKSLLAKHGWEVYGYCERGGKTWLSKHDVPCMESDHPKVQEYLETASRQPDDRKAPLIRRIAKLDLPVPPEFEVAGTWADAFSPESWYQHRDGTIQRRGPCPVSSNPDWRTLKLKVDLPTNFAKHNGKVWSAKDWTGEYRAPDKNEAYLNKMWLCVCRYSNEITTPRLIIEVEEVKEEKTEPPVPPEFRVAGDWGSLIDKGEWFQTNRGMVARAFTTFSQPDTRPLKLKIDLPANIVKHDGKRWRAKDWMGYRPPEGGDFFRAAIGGKFCFCSCSNEITTPRLIIEVEEVKEEKTEPPVPPEFEVAGDWELPTMPSEPGQWYQSETGEIIYAFNDTLLGRRARRLRLTVNLPTNIVKHDGKRWRAKDWSGAYRPPEQGDWFRAAGGNSFYFCSHSSVITTPHLIIEVEEVEPTLLVAYESGQGYIAWARDGSKAEANCGRDPYWQRIGTVTMDMEGGEG